MEAIELKTTKLFCPSCGRCIGQSTSTDDTSIEKVLLQLPKNIKKKQMIYEVKCIKCKNHVFISAEFLD